jgi:DNA-binding NarL/FixJ family response regulator
LTLNDPETKPGSRPATRLGEKPGGSTEKPTLARLPRIGLVASDALRIVGLRAILGDGEIYEIVPVEGGPGVEAATGLDLVIVDAPADGQGAGQVAAMLAASRRRQPRLAVIVLGAETDFGHIERVIGAGAKGYLSHAADERELRAAIEIVRDGSIWAPRKVLSRLLEGSRQEGPPSQLDTIRFTRREMEVLRLLVSGQPNRQIAQALGVDEGTIKAHMGRLMRKAGVDNRTALTMRAIERNWT